MRGVRRSGNASDMIRYTTECTIYETQGVIRAADWRRFEVAVVQVTSSIETHPRPGAKMKLNIRFPVLARVSPLRKPETKLRTLVSYTHLAEVPEVSVGEAEIALPPVDHFHQNIHAPCRS